MENANRNIRHDVVKDFGLEWNSFNQTEVSDRELEKLFDEYFAIFPWETLPKYPKGFDLGCGSGRWTRFVAPRVYELHCIDPSQMALNVAIRTLSKQENCKFHLAGVSNMPIQDDSMDFGYSLGVLHHVPDTKDGIQSCVKKLKPGAPFLLYLYYTFDNRPIWFRMLWRITDFIRRILCRAPYPIKYLASQFIAAVIYYPLAGISRFLSKFGFSVNNIPLSSYKDKSFYTMRTDALDRFGTRLEQRFTKQHIEAMMIAAGLSDIKFSNRPPYWCAVGFRR